MIIEVLTLVLMSTIQDDILFSGRLQKNTKVKEPNFVEETFFVSKDICKLYECYATH